MSNLEVVARLENLLAAEVVDECRRRLPSWTADEESALVNGERWLECYLDEQGYVPDIAGDLDWLLPTWASGAFLPRLLVRRPWLFDRFRVSSYHRQSKPRDAFLTELLERTQPLADLGSLSSTLREYKTEEIFHTGVRDLAGWLTVEQVTAELSALADATTEAAYRFIRRLLAEDYGEPLGTGGQPAAFFVIGMGKLGGNELNFSSDIDLVYLFDEDGETAGGRLGSISNREFFEKLAIKLTSAINDVTADGFVFRVDLRLRPEGKQGPLVASVTGAENYYMNWGLTWERAALLKARPIAGDLECGEELLEVLSSFVYRRHLDYSTVEDIKLMKRKIDLSLSRSLTDAWDVKLGSGGIREIEFIVQTLLLVHAGKKKSLRTRSTLDGLRGLDEIGLLEPGDCERLSAAYRFLRRLEHRLQIENERQTQRLPNAEAAHTRMAKLLGYDAPGDEGRNRFEIDLEAHRKNVQAMFRRLFDEPGEELGKDIHPAVFAVIEPEGPDVERLEVLAKLGFSEPERALTAMRRLVEAREIRHLDSKGRRYLERIMPLFLSECISAPDPDMALSHLEDFMQRVGGWSSYHSMLAENPATLKLLVRFFGTSAFLSRFFIKHPELLDQLVLSSYATPLKDAARLHEDLALLLAEAEDEEETLDSLRRFKNGEVLRVAINDIDGQLGLIEVTAQLADLADAVLQAAARMAFDRAVERYGKPPPGAELVILGMGKFGGREMNYSSDLDLIFIYTGEGLTSGPKSVTLAEFFSKVIQRIITNLTLSTREGVAYPIDTRLRPSGNAGPLVTSLNSFNLYHQTAAAVWERQALIRARPVGGTAEVAERIREILHHTIYERPFTPENIAEILRMRRRMEREIGPENQGRLNIKTGRGGVVDIEFFVQIMQLQHGGEYHSLRNPNTYQALEELHELHLVDAAHYHQLRDAFLFLRRIENRMRILQDNAKSILQTDPLALEPLALSLNYERGPVRGAAGQALLRDIESTRAAVREIYQHYFEKE